ncbi:hypothetical protein [Cupriavidus gilardii]|nr:hypothetical protein [Cupriavidus gilardii]UXC37205.1 hypothetical protein N4G38_07095 [Cupriavidus gilardii]
MKVTGELDAEGAKQYAARLGVAYVIGSIGAACAGIAALVWAIRWW